MSDRAQERIDRRRCRKGTDGSSIRMLLTTMVAAATLAMWCGVADAQDSFNGYPCTDDCSGHQAGYDWAERNGIADPGDCGGNSQSFIEGCQSYTEENAGSSGEDSQDEDEDEESTDDGDSE